MMLRLARSLVAKPVPLILHGQFAVDTEYQGLGFDLRVDAAKRALSAVEFIGARTIVVQALDDHTKLFYARLGFRAYSEREPLMMVPWVAELMPFLDA